MIFYRKAAVDRAMKVPKVILRAMAEKTTWWQAAEILGLSDRSLRCWRERYEEFGYDGLFDRRQGKPSLKCARVSYLGRNGVYTAERSLHNGRRPVISVPAKTRRAASLLGST